MKMKNKTLCFSGHRSKKLPKEKDEFNFMIQSLNNEIDKAIYKGYDTFIFGACYGFDLLCAEQVLKRKQIIKNTVPVNIKLIAAVPFEDQAVRWNKQDRDKYFSILSKCDDVVILNKRFKAGCYHERNRYMVDSSKLICYYDGSAGGTSYTVEYAKKRSVKVINLYTSVAEYCITG